MAAAPGALAAFLAWHRACAAQAPYRTNIIQSTTLMATGDSIAQALERRARPAQAHDPSRTLILSSWAACVNAPFWCAFYAFLFTRFPGRVGLWVAASAALSAPWNAAFFAYSTAATVVAEEGARAALAERAGRERIAARVRAKLESHLAPTVRRSMTLWIPFNFVNFSITPPEYRILTGSLVALVWNVRSARRARCRRVRLLTPPPPHTHTQRAQVYLSIVNAHPEDAQEAAGAAPAVPPPVAAGVVSGKAGVGGSGAGQAAGTPRAPTALQ